MMFGEKLPYTYQAVVCIFEGEDSVTVSFFADTICALTNYLKKRREDLRRTKRYEIYKGKETLKPTKCYMDEDGKWLSRKELCHPMMVRYGDPDLEDECPFRFRSHIVN